MLPILGIFFGLVSLAMAGFILREAKVNISRRYSVYGRPARAIGLIILSYLPISFGIYYGIEYYDVELVRPGNGDLKPAAVVLIFLGVLLGCLTLSAFIALLFVEDDYWWLKPKKLPKEAPRRSRGRQLRQDEIEEMEEEKARRRRAKERAHREDEEDDDRRSRTKGRSRRDDNEDDDRRPRRRDDEDERPRRKCK